MVTVTYLFDDRTGVQIRRRIVGRGADDFHPAQVSFVVWLSSHKGGKKAVYIIGEQQRGVRAGEAVCLWEGDVGFTFGCM